MTTGEEGVVGRTPVSVTEVVVVVGVIVAEVARFGGEFLLLSFPDRSFFVSPFEE